MRQKLSMIIVPILAAAAANWCVAYCMGLLVVFFAKHKLFGFSISFAVFVEETIVYPLICLCFGLIVGFLVRSRPLLAGLFAALAATAIFAFIGYWYYWQYMNLSNTQYLKLALDALVSPGLWFVIFFPLGAYAANRYRSVPSRLPLTFT